MNGLTERQITLLTAFPVFMAIAIILSILVLRKDVKYWGNRFFALTFWLFAIALGLNLIYLFSVNTFVIIILNFFSISFAGSGSVTLLLGILVIYKGEDEIIHNKITYFSIIIIFIIIFIHSLIPNGIRVEFFIPKWSLAFGIYAIGFGQIIFFLNLFYALKLYKELSLEMQRKFKRFILGMVFVNMTFINITINNMDIIAGYNMLAALLNLGAFFGVIFIYFGIVRR